MTRIDRALTWSALVLCVGLVGISGAQSAFLYTTPDRDAAGGIQGHIAEPSLSIRQVLAIPRSRPEHVYAAELGGPNRQSFQFTGLPMDRYDLVVIYDNRFFEGLRLTRGESTLRPDEIAQIEDIIDRSEPFFPDKIIHRLEGQTGRGSEARAVTTFGREGLRRTYKLVLLRQVGPGWQVERTREWLPIDLSDGGAIASEHRFSEQLSGIRVTDQVRNLGTLHL